MKNTIIAILVAVIATGGALGALATTVEDEVTVQIRVWQRTNDTESLYISARPADGRWDTLGTIPLDMSGRNSRGTFRYGDIELDVPFTYETDVPAEPGTSELNANMETANLWVYLWDEGLIFARMEASAHTFIDMEAFDLDVVVTSGVQSETFCNTNAIFEDVPSELGCGSPDFSHRDVDNVVAVYSPTFRESHRHDCAKQSSSTRDRSTWACLLRDG